MKKLLFFLLSGILALQACAQQANIIAHRVMALDSIFVDGVWIKKTDVDRWNSGAPSGAHIDTMFVRNDSLVYAKGGLEYHLKVGSGADSTLYATVHHADSIAGLIPTAVSQLTNDAGFLSSVTWAIITGKPSFSAVAMSGDYNDLTNKPTIPNPDSTITPGGLLDTLAKHAMKIEAPLVYNPADTSLTVDTTRGPHSAATQYQVDSLGGLIGAASGTTNLSVGTKTSTTMAINSSTGTGATLPAATTSEAGLMAAASVTKLNGIAAGAAAINDAASASTTTYSSSKINALIGAAGGGDMLASVYDPTGVNGDAFDYRNMSNKPGLDDILTVGATSSIGITVGDVNTGSVTFSNPAYANLTNLATDGSGQIVEGSAPPVLGDIAINSSASISYTLSLSDKNRINSFSSSSAVTVTVPTNASVAFPVGTRLIFLQSGTGKVTFAGASGVTVGSLNALKNTAGQYGLVELVKTATDTWVLFGALQ